MDTAALIENHLGLAHSLAQQVWRTAPHALELDELRSIANLGLVGAALRWEPYCRENSFSPDALQFFKPFVVKRVRGALIDAIRQADWATRSLRTRFKLIQEAGPEPGTPLGELAERTGLTEAEIRATMRGMAQRPVSMEAEELEPAARHDVESSVFVGDVLTRMVSVLRELPGEQQVVIVLHYHRGLQLQAVAREMGITESRASQLHAKAVLAVYRLLSTAVQQDTHDADPG